jgi:hypothetical protein
MAKQRRWGVLRLKVTATRLAAFVVIVLAAAVALAGPAAWELGTYQLLNGPSSGPLLSQMSGAGSLHSYSFVGKVGGVAFAGIAVPAATWNPKALRLVYNASQPDSQRFGVRVGEHVYYQHLANWLLIPIARYADSPYNACISLFGENTDDSTYDIVYHPALKDTLLGLRLLQADMLLFDVSETWRLPTRDGTLVLGLGEVTPGGFDLASARQVTAAMEKGQFQSWVLTDHDEPIRVDLIDGQLRFTGIPYYYFWNSDFQGYRAERERLAEKAQALRRAAKVSEYNSLVERINALEPRVSEVSAITTGMKAIPQAVRGLNLSVYDAALTTVHYAAFFRYVKQRDPAGWQEFLGSLRSVVPQPQVVTPTKWKHPR